jgi:hypothetical protein
MSQKSDAVLNGLMELNEEERKEVLEALRNYEQQYTESAKRSAREDVHAKVSLGPLTGGCPCCGK